MFSGEIKQTLKTELTEKIGKTNIDEDMAEAQTCF